MIPAVALPAEPVAVILPLCVKPAPRANAASTTVLSAPVSKMNVPGVEPLTDALTRIRFWVIENGNSVDVPDPKAKRVEDERCV